jgi:signal transduction histidine kinase
MKRGLTVRMVLASGLLAIIIGGAFAALLVAITDLREANDQRRDTREELVAAEALESVIIDLETGLRGFVITGEDRFLDPATTARASFPETLNALEELAAEDPVALEQVRRIGQAARRYIREYAVPLIRAVRRNDATARSVETTDEGKRRSDALRSGFGRFREAERARLAAREVESDEAADRATVAAAVGIAGSVLLILLFTGYLTRVMVQPLRRAADLAGRLARGDLAVRMPEGGVGEIGDLARAFNTMGASLETSRDELRDLAEEQAALRRVATLVARGAPSAEVFVAVTDEVSGLLGLETTMLMRFEPDGTATFLAGSGWSSEEMQPGVRRELPPWSVSAGVMRTGESARINDYSPFSGDYADILQSEGIRAAVASPIAVEGRTWGTLTIASRHGPLPDVAEQRLVAFSELVATAIANAEARRELLASRARVVAAADETRRRIERDLHDAAQQRLVHTVIMLKLAIRAVDDGDENAGGLMREALDHAEQANSELRDLAHGILPPVLTRSGLRAGVESILSRTSLPVTAEVSGERFPPRVEATAYFIVSEALTNAVKHSGAERVEVRAQVDDGVLRVEIRDDGAGGARLEGSTGLIGLNDRVAALDGRLEVKSPPGEGTLIAATLPLAS